MAGHESNHAHVPAETSGAIRFLEEQGCTVTCGVPRGFFERLMGGNMSGVLLVGGILIAIFAVFGNLVRVWVGRRDSAAAVREADKYKRK